MCDISVIIMFVSVQGSTGPPGPEGVIGPRGEQVSRFQSLTHTEDRHCTVSSRHVDIKWHSGCFSCRPHHQLCLFFSFLFKGKQGEPGPSGKAGLPGTPVSLSFSSSY